ncbi:hypothetical protein L1987_48172 [Smallanthus sonchifolius]|uniref:Uncharacterized protein n=1 Tax=Smallanthus sonchifolius TaxID=185202 RepID=A0ACB9FR28_9ASTR|nr:hypothetical protein L1987_48172 [Smallanthus sonchifolius]
MKEAEDDDMFETDDLVTSVKTAKATLESETSYNLECREDEVPPLTEGSSGSNDKEVVITTIEEPAAPNVEAPLSANEATVEASTKDKGKMPMIEEDEKKIKLEKEENLRAAKAKEEEEMKELRREDEKAKDKRKLKNSFNFPLFPKDDDPSPPPPPQSKQSIPLEKRRSYSFT